jgi:hypothetical protein
MERLRIIVIMMILIGTLTAVFGALPIPDYEIGEIETNPGKNTVWYLACDPCGNYPGNRIFIRPIYEKSAGITVMMWHGFLYDANEPNFYVLEDAYYRPNQTHPNDPNLYDPNMYGYFAFTKVMGKDGLVIEFEAKDCFDNNSIGVSRVKTFDRGKPKIVRQSVGKSK